jgi:hypothetical protein
MTIWPQLKLRIPITPSVIPSIVRLTHALPILQFTGPC